MLFICEMFLFVILASNIMWSRTGVNTREEISSRLWITTTNQTLYFASPQGWDFILKTRKKRKLKERKCQSKYCTCFAGGKVGFFFRLGFMFTKVKQILKINVILASLGYDNPIYCTGIEMLSSAASMKDIIQ